MVYKKKKGWKPWANTLLYLPLNSTDTYTDKSWNNISTTNSNVTFGDYYWVECGIFNWSNTHIQVTPFAIPDTVTLLCRTRWPSISSSYDAKIFDARSNPTITTWKIPTTRSDWKNAYFAWLNNWGINTVQGINDQWFLFAVTIWWWTVDIYAIWDNLNIHLSDSWTINAWTPSQINIGNEYNNGASRYYSWWISELILENKKWTADEVTAYYNQTKSNYWRPKRLPSAYQEVEYIQSSWTQYFSVLNSFKTSYKTVIDFQMVTTWWDYIPLWMLKADASYKYWINAYSWYFKVISWRSWANTKSEDKNRHTFIIDKSTVTVDWTNYSINYVDVTFDFWIWVFAYHSNGGTLWQFLSSNKLYKLDIYDEGGTQIFNGVPCYRKSDSVIWMYDVINKVFYTNEWTWTFTKWPDVN